MCFCGSLHLFNPNKANWPPDFGPKHGQEFLEKAAAAGVEVHGSLQHAVEHGEAKRLPKSGVVGRKVLRKKNFRAEVKEFDKTRRCA